MTADESLNFENAQWFRRYDFVMNGANVSNLPPIGTLTVNSATCTIRTKLNLPSPATPKSSRTQRPNSSVQIQLTRIFLPLRIQPLLLENVGKYRILGYGSRKMLITFKNCGELPSQVWLARSAPFPPPPQQMPGPVRYRY